jgi:CNT family concentrative nucleoside transporter
MQAILGIAVLLLFAWLVSEARTHVRWRPVVIGLALQFALALVLLRIPAVGNTLLLLNEVVYAIERATAAGTGFVFGYLGGDPAPFDVSEPGAMYIFAFRVLPQIIVFSVLVAVFWYWRVLPLVIGAFGALLRRAMGLRGAVGMAAASSIFLGPVEIPLMIRGYLQSLSRSEFFTMMTCGMSTVAGSIMVLYASVLRDVIPGALGHILIGSVINVLGAVMISRIMIPERTTLPDAEVAQGLVYTSAMDAITRGTADGLRLAANVGGMLIVLVSLVALVNQVIGMVEVGDTPLTLQRAMGWLFAPVAWLIGIPWSEAQAAGSLLGIKLILNELVGYLELARMGSEELGDASRLVMTYALCSFANFGSLGILMGGLGTLVPERRAEVLAIAPRTLISGTLVSCLTGAVVALVMLL